MPQVESVSQCLLTWASGLLRTDAQLAAITPGLARLEDGVTPAVYWQVKPLGAVHICATVWCKPQPTLMAQGEVYQGTWVDFRIGFHDAQYDPSNLFALRKRAQEIFTNATGSNVYGFINQVMWIREWEPSVFYDDTKPFVGLGDFYRAFVQGAESV